MALGKGSSHRPEDTEHSSGMPFRDGCVSVAWCVSHEGRCAGSSKWKVQAHFSILPGPVPILLFLEMLYRPVRTPELPCGRAPVLAAGWVWETEVTSFCGYICIGSNLFLLWFVWLFGFGGLRMEVIFPNHILRWRDSSWHLSFKTSSVGSCPKVLSAMRDFLLYIPSLPP